MSEQEQAQIFEDWLKKYQSLLFKVVRAYAPVPQDREDLFQEICLQVWRSIKNFRQQSAETTWIYRVALNTALTWKKKAYRQQEKITDLDQNHKLLQEAPEAENERLDWLFRQISRLDKIDRSLALLLLDGFSYKEMAQLMGISESNVGVKIHRIKTRLVKQAEKSLQDGI